MQLLLAWLRTIRATCFGVAATPRRRLTARRRPVVLSVTLLEPRETPAAPIGLTDVPMLLPSPDLPTGYAETHGITRGETTTVTVDQSGTGSSGTFTIDVVGSAQSGDTASGSGGGDSSVTASGTGSSQFSYHLIISGTYAGGVFTVTTESYDETGTYSSSQNVTWTHSSEGGSSTNHWDTTHSRDYTLSWSAAVDAAGQLVYTSYTYDANETAHWYTYSGSSGGGYAEATYDASSSVSTTGSGSSASYTGSNSWHEHHHVYQPIPGVPPYDYSWDSGWDNPISGTAYLGPVYEPTTGWQWRAGSPDATGFTFHGVGSESASLTETATYRVTEYGTEFDVDSFSSSYHSSDLGHVVDDEPGVPDSGSGTDLFHRDETVSAADNVTGSGSYVGGSANASFHAVESGSYSVANSYTVNNDYSSGDDEDGDPYELWFNFQKDTTGGGSITATRDYHDAGLGLALTGESFDGSGSSLTSSRAWGTRNGEAFDEPSETPESWGGSVSLPGDPVPVDIPDGMETAFPLMGMANPAGVFFAGQSMQLPLPSSPVPGRLGSPQNMYNKIITRIGEQAKGKVVKLELRKAVMTDIAAHNKPSGSFNIDEGGYAIAANIGYRTQLDADSKNWVRQLKAQGYTSIKTKPSKLEVSYAVDMTPSPNPAKKRSGNVAVEFRVIWRFEVTKKNGQTITVERQASILGGAQFRDGNLENRNFQP